MKKALTILIIPVILLLFYNQAANWHLHKLPNGIVVEHAHPFSDSKSSESPYQNHAHTDMEFLVIGLISVTIGLVIFTLILALVLQLRQNAKQTSKYAFSIPSDYPPAINPLRGPPEFS